MNNIVASKQAVELTDEMVKQEKSIVPFRRDKVRHVKVSSLFSNILSRQHSVYKIE